MHAPLCSLFRLPPVTPRPLPCRCLVAHTPDASLPCPPPPPPAHTHLPEDPLSLPVTRRPRAPPPRPPPRALAMATHAHGSAGSLPLSSHCTGQSLTCSGPEPITCAPAVVVLVSKPSSLKALPRVLRLAGRKPVSVLQSKTTRDGGPGKYL